MRWNLVAFGAGIMLAMFVVVGFAVWMLRPEIIKTNEEMLIVGVFGLLTSVVAGFVGYCTGVQQSLTGPPSPAPTITEATALELMRMAKS